MNYFDATDEDIRTYAHELLLRCRQEPSTFEETSQLIVRSIFTHLRDEDESILFPLVRVFRLCDAQYLPPEQPVGKDGHWLALTGTYGTEPAWCQRLKSQNHRVIPSGSFSTPMLKAVFDQLDIKLNQQGKPVQPMPNFFVEDLNQEKTFYIEHAAGDPRVVDQDRFVKPYGIRSVVGLGGTFLSQATFVLIAFASQHLPRPVAVKFTALSPYIATALAIFDNEGKIWDTST